ncbi:endonuclease III [Fonticella tunisiensis]|uniref:Endonuclease III n=1 Tax=Fonticella tunisiensis TaxID=1096341 RepID=A0A4R7K3Z9_9CLOT|nr:endonuclease III [Fonticella tunisiensis]TDT45662.1 DNA-(apurinic or apyrimidinic site) lyase /endonuclease III [Fonticella tunisiensis]
MEKIKEVLEILEEHYGDMGCALNFKSPFELLVATMLSAQTTDVTVNKATAVLFEKYNTPEDFAALKPEELEPYIKTCGFYKTKAQNIINASRKILTDFNGKVPKRLEDLTSLPGVGRKTANVVLSNAFGVDAIAVDTHVFRVSNRIGLAHADNVEDTEMQLMENIPKEYWSRAHHWLIWHGRKVCTARRPKCEICPVNRLCNYYEELNKSKKTSEE